MSIKEFLAELEDRQIQVRLVKGQVKVVADRNKLSGELLEQLSAKKEALAAFLSQQDITTHPGLVEPIEEQEYYAVSCAQKRLWIISQLNKDDVAYIIAGGCWFEGNLELPVFEKALHQLVQRHESLRTCFTTVNGEPMQKIKAVSEISANLQYIDLSRDDDSSRRIRHWEAIVAQTPFDLQAAPLLRSVLIKKSENSYLFLFSMHHIISDGWSMDILKNELVALYAANLNNDFTGITKPLIQYRDYAAWQHAAIRAGRFNSSKAYWLQVLQDGLPETKIAAIQAGAGDEQAAATISYEFTIDRHLIEQLSNTGKKTGSSLFMVLVSTIKLLLYHYTGKYHLVTGIPAAGRKYSGLFGQVGFFVNMLPLKIELQPADTFTSLLEKVTTAVLLCLEHQDYPFSEILNDAPRPVAGSKLTLPNVVINYNNGKAGTSANNTGLSVQPYGIKNKTGKFDLVISFTETNEGIITDFECDGQQYADWFIKQMAEHLQVLMKKLVEMPEARVLQLLPFTSIETDRMVHKNNDTRKEHLSQKTVKEIFEETVAIHGCRIALVGQGGAHTYESLNRQANQLAGYLLSKKNLGADDIVAIIAGRSEKLIIALLAVVKCGAAYLCIEADNPPERMAYLLRDANPALVMTEMALRDTISPLTGPGLLLLADDPAAGNFPGENIKTQKQPGHLAYIMYTSGSTGLPKGVMLEDRGIVRMVKETNYIDIGVADKLVMTGALSFDAIIFEIWCPLLNGGELHLLTKDQLMNTEYLKTYFSSREITTMLFTTSWFNRIVETDIEVLASLSKILIGGEKLSAHHIRQARKAFPHLQLINAYGPTENTTISIACSIGENVADNIPLGKPITNSEAYILNNDAQLVPAGVWGEIVLGGDGLARGYINNAALTAAKFIPHPFRKNAFVYKTGDIGRWLPGGYFEYHGRLDSQVKIRGFRIEPGEIENTLLACTQVRQAIVLVAGDKKGEKELVALYTGNIHSGELRSYLAQRLPVYMIPRLIELEQFPLTENGKADRAALLEMASAPVAGNAKKELLNEWQVEMAAIWEKVLQVTPIGRDNNFFELGGHSLKAMQLIAEVHKKMGIGLTLGDIFLHPTIDQLYQASAGAETTNGSITRAAQQDSYELSHAQLRLWISSQYQQSKHAFNMPGVYEIKGRLDIESFSKSITALAERHEVLRTAIVMDNGGPKQKITPLEQLPEFIEIYDEQDILAENLSVEEWIAGKTESQFDLECPPLFRVHLLKQQKDQHLLIFVLHHIVSDAWSTGVLIRDFSALYKAFRAGLTNPLPPLPIQYKDYAHWHNAFLQSKTAETHRAYWQQCFYTPPPLLNLPADKPRPVVKTYNGNRYSITLDKNETAMLERLGKTANATLYIVMQAVFKTLFFAYSRQTDITIGVLAAARAHAGLEDQVGFYINNLPVRTVFTGSDSFSDLLQKVKKTAIGAFDHQLYPFDLIVENAGIKNQPGRSPLFDVMIQLLHDNPDTLGNERFEDIQIAEKNIAFLQARYDLEITLLHSDQQITCEIKYNTDIYCPATILLLGGRLKFLVAAVTRDPLQSLHQLASAVSGYFPHPDEKNTAYKKSINYLFWSDKINRFFSEPPCSFNASQPFQNTMLKQNLYKLDRNTWLQVAGQSGFLKEVDEWIMASAALSLVLYKYGHARVLFGSFGYRKEKNGSKGWLFFDACEPQISDSTKLVQCFREQYAESLVYHDYSFKWLENHLLLNDICNSRQLFEAGIGISSLHHVDACRLLGFKLFFLVDNSGEDYTLHIWFDPFRYDSEFIDQLYNHFSKAVAFLLPEWTTIKTI